MVIDMKKVFDKISEREFEQKVMELYPSATNTLRANCGSMIRYFDRDQIVGQYAKNGITWITIGEDKNDVPCHQLD